MSFSFSVHVWSTLLPCFSTSLLYSTRGLIFQQASPHREWTWHLQFCIDHWTLVAVTSIYFQTRRSLQWNTRLSMNPPLLSSGNIRAFHWLGHVRPPQNCWRRAVSLGCSYGTSHQGSVSASGTETLGSGSSTSHSWFLICQAVFQNCHAALKPNQPYA